MANPYTLLNVPKNATAEQIKAAYRRLAKKYHPDQNKGDVKAQERFAAINNAYSILGDKKKRAQFDRGEIDENGQPIHPGFGGFQHAHTGGRRGQFGGGQFQEQVFTGDEGDILSEILGGLGGAKRRFTRQNSGANTRGSMKGQDIQATLALILEDILKGKKVNVSLEDGRTLAITLPKGVYDGQTIRLKGQGRPSAFGGPAGDALIKVKFVPHPLFKVEGSNLHYNAPIHLHEAYLGAKLEVPTLSGRLSLTIPPRSNSGKILRIPGRGLPGKSKNGDLLVHLLIHLPDQPEPELEALLKRWAKENRPPLKAV